MKSWCICSVTGSLSCAEGISHRLRLEGPGEGKSVIRPDQPAATPPQVSPRQDRHGPHNRTDPFRPSLPSSLSRLADATPADRLTVPSATVTERTRALQALPGGRKVPGVRPEES